MLASLVPTRYEKDNVNIELYPSVRTPYFWEPLVWKLYTGTPYFHGSYVLDDTAQLTLGDIHGNALKLMYILIHHQVIKGISETDYVALVKIYNTNIESLTKKHLSDFNHIISKMKLKSKGTLRLLGDDLADRGANDYFTLKIIEKLSKEDVRFEIVFSNHTAEFINSYEKDNKFLPVGLNRSLANSMKNLRALIDKKLMDEEEIVTLYNKHYINKIKPISYTLDHEKNRITLFTHAPTGLSIVKCMADKLKISYNDQSIIELAKTIDNINSVFYQSYAKTNELSKLVYIDQPKKVNHYLDPKEHPFLHAIWNRKYDKIERPCEQNGYKLKYIHGHDKQENNNITGQIHCLDNNHGKCVPDRLIPGMINRNHTGLYQAHYTHDTQNHTKDTKQIFIHPKKPNRILLGIIGAALTLGTIAIVTLGLSFIHPALSLAQAIIGGAFTATAFACSTSWFVAKTIKNHYAEQFKIQNEYVNHHSSDKNQQSAFDLNRPFLNNYRRKDINSSLDQNPDDFQKRYNFQKPAHQ